MITSGYVPAGITEVKNEDIDAYKTSTFITGGFDGSGTYPTGSWPSNDDIFKIFDNSNNGKTQWSYPYLQSSESKLKPTFEERTKIKTLATQTNFTNDDDLKTIIINRNSVGYPTAKQWLACNNKFMNMNGNTGPTLKENYKDIQELFRKGLAMPQPTWVTDYQFLVGNKIQNFFFCDWNSEDNKIFQGGFYLFGIDAELVYKNDVSSYPHGKPDFPSYLFGLTSFVDCCLNFLSAYLLLTRNLFIFNIAFAKSNKFFI